MSLQSVDGNEGSQVEAASLVDTKWKQATVNKCSLAFVALAALQALALAAAASGLHWSNNHYLHSLGHSWIPGTDQTGTNGSKLRRQR